MDNITVKVGYRKLSIIAPCNPEVESELNAKDCSTSVTLKGDKAAGAALALHFIGAIGDDEFKTVIGE